MLRIMQIRYNTGWWNDGGLVLYRNPRWISDLFQINTSRKWLELSCVLSPVKVYICIDLKNVHLCTSIKGSIAHLAILVIQFVPSYQQYTRFCMLLFYLVFMDNGNVSHSHFYEKHIFENISLHSSNKGFVSYFIMFAFKDCRWIRHPSCRFLVH